MKITCKGQIRYVPDYALVDTDVGYTTRTWEELSEETRRRVFNHVSYGPSTYANRPLLVEVFEKCEMIVDLTTIRGKDYCALLEAYLRNEQGLKYKKKVVVVPGFAGDKMGSKKYRTFFVVTEDPLEEWAKSKEIWENLYVNMGSAERIERFKKFLGEYELFSITPRVRFIDNVPGYDGMAFCNKHWRTNCGLSEGFKMSGPAKDTVHDFRGIFDFKDVDLVVQHGGNKLKLTEDKFTELAGYAPSLFPEKRHSRMLQTVTRTGDVIVGRNPDFGLDLQATLGIKPHVDLSLVTKLLKWELDDEVQRTFFTYMDANNQEAPTSLGRDIFEYGLTMTNDRVCDEVMTIAFNHIQDRLRLRVDGEFAQAAPLSYVPDEAKRYIQKYVIVGYSGGIVGYAWAVVWNHIAYVEDAMWAAMGRDYDGDLVFLFAADRFPNIRVSTLEQIKKNYILPKKVKGAPDTRDNIKVLMDRISQGFLCGQTYNTGKVFVDVGRFMGIAVREVIDVEIQLMAMVEEFLYSNKGSVSSTKTFTFKDLQKKWKWYPGKKCKCIQMSSVLRANGPVTINKVKYHPLVALLIRAEEADPNSRSFFEQAVACIKPLLGIVRIKAYKPEEKEVEYVNEDYPE